MLHVKAIYWAYIDNIRITAHEASDDSIVRGQWKFSGDKHKSLQVDTERTFHQRYPLVML